MVYYMHLKNLPFQKMKSGEKTVELRLFDHKRRRLEIGDNIIFTNLSDESEELAVKIMALYRYASFEDLFAEISPDKCGFHNGETIEEAAAAMQQYYPEGSFSYYFGVVGIKVKVVSLKDTLKECERIQQAEYDRLFPDGMK